MMESRKSVKSAEKSLDEIDNNDDPIGLAEICPIMSQAELEVHCQTNCSWYSDDRCIVWDFAAVLRRIAGEQTLLRIKAVGGDSE
jgi:hypothetical protein